RVAYAVRQRFRSLASPTHATEIRTRSHILHQDPMALWAGTSGAQQAKLRANVIPPARRSDTCQQPATPETAGLPAPSEPTIETHYRDGKVELRPAVLADEVPIAFEYNGVSHAVMLATP